jgi:hypothetical protein
MRPFLTIVASAPGMDRRDSSEEISAISCTIPPDTRMKSAGGHRPILKLGQEKFNHQVSHRLRSKTGKRGEAHIVLMI